MPFFPKKAPPREELRDEEIEVNRRSEVREVREVKEVKAEEVEGRGQKLVFHCQQAQGSPTGLISGFTNVKELYQRISECYDFDPSEILFCTLNTHKVNMAKLLGAQIALGDFIFVHRKGRPKEIELTKSDDALGLTITDNGNGLAFIKRVKEGSIIDQVPVIQVGDHIEKIDNESLVGKRHFEVAKCLKDIPRGTTFTLRLVAPLQAGFSNIGPRGDRNKGKRGGYGSGRETLRFKAGGEAVVEVVDDAQERAVNGINAVLENFLGISDSELATRVWDLSKGQSNSIAFSEAIYHSDLAELDFSEDFIIELWGAVTDARDGRL